MYNQINDFIREIVIELFNKYSYDLKRNSMSNMNDFNDKKNLIKSFERIMTTIRYYSIGEKELYKQVTDSLEILQQLKDMRNQEKLFIQLLDEFLHIYNNEDQKLIIKGMFLVESLYAEDKGDLNLEDIYRMQMEFILSREIRTKEAPDDEHNNRVKEFTIELEDSNDNNILDMIKNIREFLNKEENIYNRDMDKDIITIYILIKSNNRG